jgi:hypothetical protein
MRYALLLLAACGASTTTPVPTGTATPVVAVDAPPVDAPSPDAAAELPPDAAEPLAANPAACPTEYAAIQPNAYCATSSGLTCAFPEGTCACGPRSYCGGRKPTPEILERLQKAAWTCKPARTDGCPEREPAGQCRTDGKVCGYGDCCKTAYTCTNGTWERGRTSCPP